jgi:hypothetical protein
VAVEWQPRILHEPIVFGGHFATTPRPIGNVPAARKMGLCLLRNAGKLLQSMAFCEKNSGLFRWGNVQSLHGQQDTNSIRLGIHPAIERICRHVHAAQNKS